MVFKKGKMLFLIPTIFYSGIEQSFIFGIFTGEIIKPTLGDGMQVERKRTIKRNIDIMTLILNTLRKDYES